MVLEDVERSAAETRQPATAKYQCPSNQPTTDARADTGDEVDAIARQVWRVKAQIVQYKLEDDFDIHLILFAQGRYLIAEMPLAGCLPRRTRDRAAIAAVRARFERKCGAASSQWRYLGAVALISGVGFWDIPHSQAGHARNYSELHPVTGLKLIAGCGA